MSGGVAGAEAGTIAIMVGAPADLFAKASRRSKRSVPMFSMPAILALAPEAINNMISSCIRLPTLEGLALATKAD